MQYLGGKSRISKQISEIINKYSAEKPFVSLFCGTASVESKVVSKSKQLNDKHEYLIALLKEVQKGWNIPDVVSKEEYYKVKVNLDENKALSGFVGFACSFGGKWWGGYAKNNSGTNYAKQSKNSLLKKMATLSLSDTKFYNVDYRDVPIEEGSVVYCDPPYKGTTGYSNSGQFNHDEFWEYVRKLSEKNIVFVSEISAPEDFVSVWEKPFKRVLDVNKDNIFKSMEKLYIHKSQANKM